MFLPEVMLQNCVGSGRFSLLLSERANLSILFYSQFRLIGGFVFRIGELSTF